MSKVVNAPVTFASNGGAGNGIPKQWAGGRALLVAQATWGGGSAKLQTLSSDGSTWVDITNASFTASGSVEVALPHGQIRCVIATSSAVYLDAHHIPYS